MRASRRRPPTSSTTSRSCCAAATAVSPTRQACSTRAAASAVAAPSAVAEYAVEPSFEHVRELARDHNLILLRHSFVADCETPVSAFLKLRTLDPARSAFLLESAEQGQRFGRYSFIGSRPRAVVRWSLGDGGDPYELAAEQVGRYRQAQLPGLPPFAGGAVGYFGYDLVRTVEPLGPPNPDPLGLPDMALMLSDLLVVFDHLQHTVTVLANVYADDDLDHSYAAAATASTEVPQALAGPVPHPQPPRPPRAPPDFRANMERAASESLVARIIE